MALVQAFVCTHFGHLVVTAITLNGQLALSDSQQMEIGALERGPLIAKLIDFGHCITYRRVTLLCRQHS